MNIFGKCDTLFRKDTISDISSGVVRTAEIYNF